MSFPANEPGVISVGAVDADGSRWDFSNYGSQMDVVAPSGDTDLDGDIFTLDRMGTDGINDTNYKTNFGGTSAACPQVAGVAAMILSINPNLTYQQVTNIINSTATDINTPGFDIETGFGLLNAGEAIAKAISSKMSVSGDGYVCWNYPKTFYLNNKPSGTYIIWTVSGNLQKLYSVSNYVVVMPKTSVSQGEGYIKATIYKSGISCSQPYVQKNVWVGKPYSSYESLIGGYQNFYPSPFPCIYTYGIYYGLTLSGRIEGTTCDANYVWSGLYTSLTKLAWNGAKFVPNYPGAPYYGGGYVQVTGSNECGTSIPVAAGYGPCGGFMASPNPADSYVVIDIDPEKFDPDKLSSGIECALYVYNNLGGVKYTSQFKDCPYRINTGSWQEGVYFIQIRFDGENYSLPVTIRH